MRTLIEILTWGLFGNAAIFLTYQTWHVVNGTPVHFDSAISATIVAGMVTATWLTMLGRLSFKMDKTLAEWLTSLALLIGALTVDVLVAVSYIANWIFPANFALLVIIGHVLSHVAQVLVRAASDAKQRFSSAFVSPDQRIATLQHEKALLEQRLSTAEQRASGAEEKLKRARAKQERSYTTRCEYCGATFEHQSKGSAQRALRAHSAYCSVRPSAESNGRRREAVAA